MKKCLIRSLIIIIGILLFNYGCVYADGMNIITNSDVKLNINNKPYKSKNAIKNINGYVYIGINDINTMFGYGYKIDDNKKIFYLTESNDNIGFEREERYNYIMNAIKNHNINSISDNELEFIKDFDVEFLLDDSIYSEKVYDLQFNSLSLGKAFCINDIWYIPLRSIVESNKCNFQWNSKERIISIEYNVFLLPCKNTDYAIIYYNTLGLKFVITLYNDNLDNSKYLMLTAVEGDLSNADNLKKLSDLLNLSDVHKRSIYKIDNNMYDKLISYINALSNYISISNNDIQTKGDFNCKTLDRKGVIFDYYPDVNGLYNYYADLKSSIENITRVALQFVMYYSY